MIEDGPDAFMQRWRRYAADAVLFARPEGSPLLEAEVAGAVLQVLERTNPYLAAPGPARLLVNPTVAVLQPGDASDPGLAVPSRGALEGEGEVLAREGRIVVVDVGAPLVLACDPDPGDEVAVGSWVRFEATPPIHGFVLPTERRGGPSDGRSVDDAP